MKKYSLYRSERGIISVSLILALLCSAAPISLFAAPLPATLEIVVAVVGGTLTPQDFQVTVTGDQVVPNSFAGSATGTTQIIPPDSFYAVNVGHVAHYRTTLSPECFGVLAEGASARCTITNIFSSGGGATLDITTRVINSRGGVNSAEDFIVNIRNVGATPSFFRGSDTVRSVTVTPGTAFTVEVSPGSRYAATLSSSCSGVIPEGDIFSCNVILHDLPLFRGQTSPNLITNAQLEIADASDATRPMGWQKGFPWGANVATYAYPVMASGTTDISSGKAMSVTYDAYVGDVLTGGDAKWYSAPSPVIPGHRYQYQDAYRANTSTYLVAEFFTASGSHLSNAGYYLVPPTTGDAWKIASASFIAPPDAASMVVYHQLNSAGTLTIDNVTLMEIALPTAFDRGFVSLAFDDGYVSHFENARPILNTAGVKGTFFAVSHTSGFGVLNPSFETAEGGDASKPLGWTSTGGLNTSYTYPVPGHVGHAAQISSTAADPVSGWKSAPVTVFANQSHEFSHYYKSTAPSTLYIEVIKEDGSIAYMQSDGGLVPALVPFVTLPPALDWTLYESPELWIPPASASVSMRYTLTASGTLAIDDVNMGGYRDFMTPANLLTLQSEQHEIAGHTETHADLTAVTGGRTLSEIRGSRTDLISGGLTPVLAFAYPLGNNNEAIQAEVAAAGYTSARGTIAGLNGRNANRFALMSTMVMADTPMADIERLVNEAVAERSWVILTFHHILPEGAPERTAYTTTPERLTSILSYLSQNNVPVRTVSDGAGLMEGGSTPVVVTQSSNATTTATTTATSTPSTTATATSSAATSTSATTATTTATTTPPTATTSTQSITPQPPPNPPASPSSSSGSTNFTYWGCTNPSAINYNRLANRNDNSCILSEVLGTTTVQANMNATTSSTTIAFPKLGIVIGGTPRAPIGGEVLGTTTAPISTPMAMEVRFKSYLRHGSRGMEVMELQRYLLSSGLYTGPVTGYFGNLTSGAVKKFQKMYNIEQVGFVGPKTRAELNNRAGRNGQSVESWVVMSTGPELSIEKI